MTARPPRGRRVARLVCAATVLVGAALAPALGAELRGVELPDSTTVGETELVLNGLGLREATLLKVDVYVAGLYLRERSSDADRILSADRLWRVDMRFVRRVDREDVAAAWDEGFEAKGADMAKLSDRLERLKATTRSVDEGDRMLFTYVPGSGVEVRVANDPPTTIAGSDFARALLSVWLGPEPPNKGLKRGMLGTRRR